MTVIVWDGKILAADKQATEGGVKRKVTKIKRVAKGKFKGWLMGGSGPCAQANAMMMWFEAGAKEDKFPHLQEDDELGAVLTVISPTKDVMRFEYTPVPIVFEEAVFATGSGRDVAYGALAMGADARRAVAVACDFMSDCGMGIDYLELKEKKK